MALPTSGPLSLADFNTTLGYTSTAQISLNDNAVRVLGNTSGGTTPIGNPVAMSAFYGHAKRGTTVSVTSYSNGTTFSTNYGSSGYKMYPGYISLPTGGTSTITNFGPVSTRYVSDGQIAAGNSGDTWDNTLCFVHPYTTVTESTLNRFGFTLAEARKAVDIVITNWGAWVNDNLTMNYAVLTAASSNMDSAVVHSMAYFSDNYADMHYHSSSSYGSYSAYDVPTPPYTLTVPNPAQDEIIFLCETEPGYPKSFGRTITVTYTPFS